MSKLNLIQAVNLALREEMERDKNIVILGEDVGKDGGVFRATEGLLKQFGPERVIDTPLSESAIVGAATGMALYGLIPIVEIQFMGFLYAAMEQLISHTTRIRTRSLSRYSAPLVIRTPYGGGIHAPEHHSESMEALLVHTPGLKVVVPSTPSEAKGLLLASIRDPDPVIFLEPTRIYRAIKEEVSDSDGFIPLGHARVVEKGDQVTLIAWGAMLHTTLKAVHAAHQRGISAEVIDLRTLSPWDVETVLTSIRKTHRAVIVHEAPRTCGLGAEISAQIHERALLFLEAPVERVTGFDTPIPLPRREHYYLPDVHDVEQAIDRVINF